MPLDVGASFGEEKRLNCKANKDLQIGYCFSPRPRALRSVSCRTATFVASTFVFSMPFDALSVLQFQAIVVWFRNSWKDERKIASYFISNCFREASCVVDCDALVPNGNSIIIIQQTQFAVVKKRFFSTEKRRRWYLILNENWNRRENNLFAFDKIICLQYFVLNKIIVIIIWLQNFSIKTCYQKYSDMNFILLQL